MIPLKTVNDLINKHALLEKELSSSEIDKNSFAEDYAKTLEKWFYNFNDNWNGISEMGFNQKFKRLWDFYLAYCRGGFISTRINVSQYLFEAK